MSAWVRDVQPRIPARKGGFAIFVPADFQEEAIREALEQVDGRWRYQTIAFSFPRRHSKTTLMALLVVWRFTLHGPGENIVCMARLIEIAEENAVSTANQI